MVPRSAFDVALRAEPLTRGAPVFAAEEAVLTRPMNRQRVGFSRVSVVQMLRGAVCQPLTCDAPVFAAQEAVLTPAHESAPSITAASVLRPAAR
jgi:hypothetical protein